MTIRRSAILIVLLFLLPTFIQAQAEPRKTYPTAESAYHDLSQMTYTARRTAFKQLAPAIQDSVWQVHLKNLLAERADLTDDERSVILEGIGLLDVGLATVDRDDPVWALKVYRPLQALQARANTGCRPEIIKAAFGVLGPARNDQSEERSSARLRLGRVAPQIGPSWGPCDCNVSHDFCGDITSVQSCQGLSCDHSDRGCGWFWMQECNGICY